MRPLVPAALLSVALFWASGCGDAADPAEVSAGGPGLDGVGAECEGATGPRQLRLLTRREYNATVQEVLSALGHKDAFAGAPGEACVADAGCAISEESCVAGACAKDPCNLKTFYLPANGASYGSVVVAGSFNAWGATDAAGGYAMTYVPELDAWVTKRALPDGEHAYKLVADGTLWMTDPLSPATVDDGFGGTNSLLVVACEGVSAPESADASLSAGFPVESRPEGYPFDNHASALVTSVHVEQYLRAGARIADVLTANTEATMGCSASEVGCVQGFIERLGKLMFRRPLTVDEAARYGALYAAQPDDATALRVVVRVMTSSPYFLYRFELGAPAGDGVYLLSPYEVASALSYGLWGTMPDEALFDAAATGALGTTEGIVAQAERMLDDARAEPLLRTFAAQWLGIESLTDAERRADLYPLWNAELAASMQEQTVRFFSDVVLGEQGSFDDLYLADHSAIDAGLAEIYGAEPVSDGFQERTLPEERRAGLLGQASVLSATSHSDQTSPVRRGVFVRTRLLCETFGTPPANAGTVPDIDPNATTRERFGQHSEDPACASCHTRIDPIGFGFEAFDAMGQYRTEENGLPIDASGQLTLNEGETAFATLPELGRALAESEAAKHCFVEQTFRFAKGDLASYADGCVLDALTAHFEDKDLRIRDLLVALTTVPSFVRRK